MGFANTQPSGSYQRLVDSDSEPQQDLEQQGQVVPWSGDEVNRASQQESNIHILPSQKPEHTLRYGLLLYGFSTLLATLMGTCAKILGREGIPVFQVVLARSMFMLALSYPRVLWKGLNPLGNRRGLLFIRGVCGFGSVSTLYWSVNLLPLSDATVFQFLAPFVVAVTAPLLLKEPPTRTTAFSIPACITGVILVSQPSFIFGGLGLSTAGVMISLLQAVFSAFAKMSVRELRKTDDDNVIVFFMAMVSTVGASFMCLVMPRQFVVPWTVHQVLLLLATGLCGYLSQITMTMGLRRATASAATSMSYLSIIWALILGYTLFSEVPDMLMLLGASIIIVSTLTLSFFLKGHKKQPVHAPLLSSPPSASLPNSPFHALPPLEEVAASPRHASTGLHNDVSPLARIISLQDTRTKV